MEEWQLDFEWLKTRHYLKDSLSLEALPDLQVMLLLIGIQELGFKRSDFSKEEKQDLMHVAVCGLLESEGYFEFKGRDEDGWPHWTQIKALDLKGIKPQEELLKKKIIEYLK